MHSMFGRGAGATHVGSSRRASTQNQKDGGIRKIQLLPTGSPRENLGASRSREFPMWRIPARRGIVFACEVITEGQVHHYQKPNHAGRDENPRHGFFVP